PYPPLFRSNGYPPTRVDIARELGFRSPNAAEDHLKALARKGAIEMIPGASRGIRLPSDAEAADEHSLPVVGQVAAGAPLLALETIDYHCRLHPDFFIPLDDYLLRFRGMRMTVLIILTGDRSVGHRVI